MYQVLNMFRLVFIMWNKHCWNAECLFQGRLLKEADSDTRNVKVVFFYYNYKYESELNRGWQFKILAPYY